MDRLRKISFDDTEFMQELVAIYLDDAPQQLRELQAAAEAQDLSAIADKAHRIKGGAANVGAESLAALCAELERSARRGENQVDLEKRVEEEMARVSARFSEIVRELAGS
ncbi:MAG: Hpt domain-containing protein [Acidobacteria bacterium]|nr:Hpt domain-containing protein [Acidobacteriota bacterium]